MPRLFRKSQRYNVAKNSWLSRIVLLDNTAIEINLQPHVTGSDCLERVAQCMDIVEIDYFGLQYTCKDGYTRWVDRDKALRKQLDKYHIDGARNAELRFAVQFYVTNVSKLEFEITRYLYFLQLKDNIIRGDLKCSNEIACKLASYALQAEFGDYDETKHTQEFLDDCILFPSYMTLDESLYEKVSRLHQRHRTMSAATAELAYIKLAQQLIEYGHEPLQQLEVNGMRIWIGACFIGIFIKHGNGQPTVYFKWPEILRMKVKDRSFAVETQQETVYFKMLDTQTAEYILRMMVHQHMFYQTEYQGLNVKWNAMKSKRKSASLHDVSSISVKSDRKEGGSLRKHDRGMKFSRPLGQPGQRESLLEPLTPTHIKLEENPFPPSLEVHSGAVSDSNHRLTPVAWQEKEPEENKKAKEKGLNRTAIIEKIPVEEDNIDIGQPLTSSDIKKTLETAQPSNFGTYPRDSPRSNGLPPTHHQFTSSNIEGSGGSQESFELSHARNEHLKDFRVPPQSLMLSKPALPDDQWEHEATSGTRDQRGQHLEKLLQSGVVYSEFENTPRINLEADVSVGTDTKNATRNRYKDIVPYEHNRVKLDVSRNHQYNDYVNASYVSFTVGEQSHRYIVSQGPTEKTCVDFWQMIWEQNTHLILMLTNEMEEGKKKCHQYFPQDKDKSVQFEQYRVSLKFVETSAATITRGLVLYYVPTGEMREIMHIQYIDWVDHGIPDDPQPFISFLHMVKSLKYKFDQSIPIVVHCSAGVGRSGVLVLSDMLTHTYDNGEMVDIPKSLMFLRSQRMHLVQTLGQYRFLYIVIIQYIKNARLI